MAKNTGSKKSEQNDETSNDDDDSFARLRAMLDGDIKAAQESGATNQSDDVVGYWSPEDAPIMCIPRGVKIFDGTIDEMKPSMLLIVELTKPTVVKLSRKEDDDDEDEEAERLIAQPGDMVGVWYKPGMKTIRDHYNSKVTILLNGKEKDTGKPNPMKLFDVISHGRSGRIPVLEDTREKSARIRTPFDAVRPVGDDFQKQDGTQRF